MLDVLDAVACSAGQTWLTELSVVACMALGFALLQGKQSGSALAPVKQEAADEASSTLCRSIEMEAARGNSKAAIALWRAAKFYTPTPCATLRDVARALLIEEPGSFIDEVVDHMAMHEERLANAGAAAAVLEAPAGLGDADATEGLLEAIEERFGLSATPRMHDALLQSCALAGRPERANQCVARIRARGQTVTARGHALAIRGFVERGLVDAAVEQAAAMRGQGLPVPRGAAEGILVLACRAGRAGEVLERAHREVGLTAEAAEILLGHCSRNRDVCLAQRVALLANAGQVPLTLTARAALADLGLGGAAPGA